MADVPLRVDLLPRPLHRVGQRPGRRARDPRAEPLLVHGPLLPRRLPAPEGPVHGQVADVQAAAPVDLHARRRLPGPARARATRRPSSRPRRSSSASGCGRHVLRGRPLAHTATSHARPSPGIGRLAARDRRARRARGDLRLPAGPQLEALRVPQGHRPVRRAGRSTSGSRTPSREHQQAVADDIFTPHPRALRRARGPRPQEHRASGSARERRAAARAPPGRRRADDWRPRSPAPRHGRIAHALEGRGRRRRATSRSRPCARSAGRRFVLVVLVHPGLEHRPDPVPLAGRTRRSRVPYTTFRPQVENGNVGGLLPRRRDPGRRSSRR